MVAELTFVIPGQPVPKGRPRFSKHAFTPKRTRDYEKAARHTAFQAVQQWQNTHGGWGLQNRYSVSLFLFFSDLRKRDLDNAGKSILDAMNGVVYNDDAQIDELFARRLVDKDVPRAVVSVRVIQ